MTPLERAVSRSHAYSLLSRIYLDGLTDDMYAWVSTIPSWEAACPKSFDVEQAAAQYQRLFGFNVPPYASIFMEAEGHLGGAVTTYADRKFREAGLEIKASDVMPDHAGLELAYLGHLSMLEARCLEEGDQMRYELMQEEIGAFTSNHLLHWLPVFVQTLQAQGDPFFAHVARTTWDLVADHTKDMKLFFDKEEKQQSENGERARGERGNMMEIAEQLVRPQRCGFYLSRDQMSDLGRKLDVPTGFIERKQMMINLLETALRFDALPKLVNVLGHHISYCRTFYNDLFVEADAGFAAILKQLHDRLDHGQDTLKVLEKRSRQPGAIHE